MENRTMLHALQKFFETNMQPSYPAGAKQGIDHALQLATAALLIEMSRADFTERDEEHRVINDNLLHFFDLTAEETHSLMTLAVKEVDESTCLHSFTSLINRHYTPEQKVAIVEMLWRVCYADGHKDMHEEHLVRKVANLLHVPHQDFISARQRIESETN